MPTTTTPTAEDVAVEFVATKQALASIVALLTGDVRELDRWASESPVEFPLEPDGNGLWERQFADGLNRRADELQLDILDSLGSWFTGEASRLRNLQEADIPADTFTIPETVTVDGRKAFELMVELLTAESVLDLVGGERPVSGDYVCGPIAEMWGLLFGSLYTGDDLDDLEPVPLYAEAERQAKLALARREGGNDAG